MSRATELHFRHPREIGDAFYDPNVRTTAQLLIFCFYVSQVTYTGKPADFRTIHVSSKKIQKVLPFRSSNVRLPQYRIDERRQSPFVGPHNYNAIESFKMMNTQPCMVSFKPDCTNGSDCFSIVGGARVYIPAFEKPKERRRLIEQTQDISLLPRAPLPKGLKHN